MSTEPDLHTDCIRADPNDDAYPLALDHEERVRQGIANAYSTEEWEEGGLNDICDGAEELVGYILSFPTPHARYQAMVGVIGNLLFVAAPPRPGAPTVDFSDAYDRHKQEITEELHLSEVLDGGHHGVEDWARARTTDLLNILRGQRTAKQEAEVLQAILHYLLVDLGHATINVVDMETTLDNLPKPKESTP